MRAFLFFSSGWEEYDKFYLFHEDKTPEEFQSDCKKAMSDVLSEVVEDEEEMKKNYLLNALKLLNKSVDKMLEMGYSTIEVESSFMVPGDDNSYISNFESIKEMKRCIPKFLVNKFYNTAIEYDKVRKKR